MTDTLDMSEDRNLDAAELALRVLPPEAEARARARAGADPLFAAEVEIWETRLAALAAGILPVEPSARVWARLQASLGMAANDNGRLAFWRRWAVGSTGLLAASLAGLAILLATPEPPAPSPAAGLTRVATLSLEGGATAVTLAYDPATGNLFVGPTAALPAGGAVPHLWLMLPDGGVQLVGPIDGAQPATHNLSATLVGIAGEATGVAISLEAPGHTPAADQPDGPVVASGELQRL